MAQPAAPSPAFTAALAAIRAYAEAHVRHYRLPGLTLGLTLGPTLGPTGADGFSTVINVGFANRDSSRPITPDTLFQIGSISKLFVAAILHQLAAEGRLRLTDRFSDLLPDIPLPPGNAIQVRHLLDHQAGLPADAPLFPAGGLWTAYPPGAHWAYSNTGYDILGKLIEHLAAKPLAQVIRDRLLAPLRMTRSRGAIVAGDRLAYAQGYELATEGPYAIGLPLAPAAWVDVTFAAGSVASTADDMNRLLRSLAGAAQGRGGLGLAPEAALAFATHAVPSDTPAMRYGNGLMHVVSGGRSYLHHTGGMVSFASAFHLDTASGAGAFASAPVSAFLEYRPRTLTQFAADCLTNAALGRPLPAAPPLATPLANAATYVGRYSGPDGSFEIVAGNPLTIIAGGRSAPLQPWSGDIFRTTHPDFHAFSLMFERRGTALVGASWGGSSYGRAGAAFAAPASNKALARLAGRFVSDSPWFGLARVVERGGRLWLGTEIPMVQIAANLWRVGTEAWSPERAAFADFIDGRPQTLTFSGEKFTRHDL